MKLLGVKQSKEHRDNPERLKELGPIAGDHCHVKIMKIAPILCMSIVGSSQSTFAFVHTGNRGGTKEAHVSSRRGLQTVIVRAMPPPHSPDGSQDWKATAWEAGGGREAAEDLEHTERGNEETRSVTL